MKKITLTTAFALLLIFLSSCLTTLHPIFTEKDLVFKPELLGKWKTKKNGESTGSIEITALRDDHSIELPGNISALKNKGYLITDLSSEQHIAFLAQIGKHLYFDYYPVLTEEEMKGDEFYFSHFTKMHTPYRVEIKNGEFELSQLESGYLKKLIEEKKIRIRHEVKSDGELLITASTEELQQYILKYGDDPGALMDKTIFSK